MQDKKFQDKMSSQLQSFERASADRRVKILDNINARIQKREETFQSGQQKWSKNQLNKKDRKTRDLHFELALGAKRTLNIQNNHQRHRVDQESGIDNFEMNMKRNGIGGDVDEGGTLLPSSEDSSVFMNRLELNAARDWPTDGEVGDLMQVLEKRTKELRVARAEKARRKRRMLVDQDAALDDMGMEEEEEELLEDDGTELTTQSARELKAAHKQQAHDDRTAAAKVKHAAMVEAGETEMRIYCEQTRMRAFDEDRQTEKVQATLEAQAKRKAEKKERNHDMCKMLVQQLVNELFATGANAQDLNSKSGGPKYEENIPKSQLVTALLDISLQPQPKDENDHPLSKRAISSKASDLWISAVNLANNAGKWSALTQDNAISFDICTNDYGRTSSFSENAVKILSELVKFLQMEGVCPFEVDATEPFREHRELMSLAEEHASKEAAAAAEGEVGGHEVEHATPARPQHVCMVLGEKHDIDQKVWSLAADWMGGDQNVACWSIDQAVEFAFDLYAAAIPEGKDVPHDDLITFAVLCKMFGVTPEGLSQSQEGLEAESVTASLAGVAMFFQTTSTIAEVIATVTRMKEASSVFPEDNSLPDTSTIELSAFEFNDATLMILSAQILWLRDFVSRQIFHILNIQPFTQHVLFFSSYGAFPDRWISVKLFDFFLKGGSRHHVPDHHGELAEEVKAEMATEKPKKGKAAPKKKDKKDKSEPIVLEESMIRSVIWIHTPPIPVVVAEESEETLEKDVVKDDEQTTEEKADNEGAEEETDAVKLYDEGLSVQSKLLSLYRCVWENKWNDIADEDKAARLTSQQAGLDSFSAAENCPVHYFTLGEGPVDFSCSNFVILNDFCALEYLLSIFLVDILDQGVAESAAAVEEEEEVERVQPIHLMGSQEQEVTRVSPSLPSHSRVLSVIEERKKLLDLAQKMWRSITMNELTLNINDVSNILIDSRRQALTCDEQLGSLVLAGLLKLESVGKELLMEKAKVIDCMKSVDEGWKKTCMQFREELKALARHSNGASNTEVQAVFSASVRELNCELGDIIDARHLEWLKLVKAQEHVFSEIVNDMTATTLDISYCFREIFSALLKKNIEVSLAIATVVFDKSGESPWPLKTACAPDGTVDKLQSTIIEQVELLHKHIISGEQSGLESDFCIDKWSQMFGDIDSFIAEAINASEDVITTAIAEEIRHEAYTSFVCLVKSFKACIDSLKTTKDNLVEDLNGYVMSRNSYEHQMLQSWIAELYQTRQNKNSEDPLSGPIQFISTYFFGLSDDPELDGVPHTSLLPPAGLVDVEDMRMDAKSLRVLAYYIVKVRQDCEFQNLSVFDTLKAIATKAIECGEALPAAWRNIKRLKALYESVLASSNDYSLSENADMFFQHLVMRLALGFLQDAPPSVYIAKLGLKIFTNTEDLSKSIFLSSGEEQIVDLSKIVAAIKQDKVLKLGWWNTDVKAAALKAHTSTVVDVVESIALMCCTSVTPISFDANDNCIDTAYVRFDTLVLLLTKNFSPINDELKIFQKTFCTSISAGGGVEQPPERKSLKEVLYPNFVDEGLSKLTNVAASLVESDNFLQSTGDVLLSFEQQLYGPTLSASKKKWLEKHLKLADDAIGAEQVTAGTLFRQTQKKKNFSFII
jgi:hypothetical protein